MHTYVYLYVCMCCLADSATHCNNNQTNNNESLKQSRPMTMLIMGLNDRVTASCDVGSNGDCTRISFWWGVRWGSHAAGAALRRRR